MSIYIISALFGVGLLIAGIFDIKSEGFISHGGIMSITAFGFIAVSIIMMVSVNEESKSLEKFTEAVSQEYKDDEVKILEVVEKRIDYNVYSIIVGDELIEAYYYKDGEIKFIKKD